MRLWIRVCARSFMGAAVLCLCAFSGNPSLAQTQQPKAMPPQQQAQPAPAPAPAPTWKVNCATGQAGIDCRAFQTLFVKRTGQRFMSVAVRVPPDTKTPTMLLGLPLGTYLPAGVSLQFGKEAAKSLPIQSCNQSGCLAEYAVSEAEIGAMLKGADITISIQDQQKKPITVTVPVAGFAEAYAKIK